MYITIWMDFLSCYILGGCWYLAVICLFLLTKKAFFLNIFLHVIRFCDIKKRSFILQIRATFFRETSPWPEFWFVVNSHAVTRLGIIP